MELRLKTGEFVINGKTVPMQREGRRVGFCARIKVDRDVYIPPRWESIIQGLAERTHHKAAGQWGIIEPGLSARALHEMGVTVGSAVTSTALRRVPVPMVNISDQECLIRKGTTVALMRPTDQIQDWQSTGRADLAPKVETQGGGESRGGEDAGHQEATTDRRGCT